MGGIDVRCYGPDGTTLIDIVPNRKRPKFQVEHNRTGKWELDIRVDDEQLKRSPALLNYRNLWRFQLEGGYTWWGRMERKKRTLISKGEYKDWVWKISGRGALCLAQDAVVYPEYGLRREAGQDRWFMFAARPGSWYKAAQWAAPLGVVQAVDTARPGAPKDWPDNDAQWIWRSDPTATAAAETIYLRKTVNVATARRYTVSVTADNEYQLWVDGQLMAKGDDWTGFQKFTMVLDVGEHTFAARVTNRDVPSVASNPAGFLLTVQSADEAGNPVLMRTDTTWKWAPENASPAVGFTPGEVMTDIMQEAEDRGVGAMAVLQPTWTTTTDSNGVAWASVVDRAFKVGTDALDVLTQLTETSVDAYVDGSLNLRIVQSLGTDRTITDPPVILRPLRDIAQHDFDGDGSGIRNALLLHTDRALTETTDAGSIAAHDRVEGYISMGDAFSDNTSDQVVAFALSERKDPLESFVVEINPAEGQVPLLDWFVGDWVLVPNETGGLEKHRCKAITVGEDDKGRLVYAPELASIMHDTAERFNRWLKSMANGTLGGSVASASPLGRDSGTASSGGGGGAGEGQTVEFERDRYPAGGTFLNIPVAFNLAYVPIEDSLHLYLNGVEADEGIDYSLAGRVVSLLGPWDAGAGDVIDARYAHLPGTPQDTDVTYFIPGPWVDNFDRDGASSYGDPGDYILDNDNGWQTDGNWRLQGNIGGGTAYLRITGGANAAGHVTATHDDFLGYASRHRVFGDFTGAGTHDCGPQGLIWGWKDNDNYWYTAWGHNDSAMGGGPIGDCNLGSKLYVGRVVNGVRTILGSTVACFDLAVNVRVDHNFETGVLTVIKEPGYNHMSSTSPDYRVELTGMTDTIIDGRFGFYAIADGNSGVYSSRHYCRHYEAETWP